MFKIRCGDLSAYFSRSLNLIFVREQGKKIFCPMTGQNVKVAIEVMMVMQREGTFSAHCSGQLDSSSALWAWVLATSG